MTSHTNARFRQALASLPPQVRSQARRAYRLFKNDPNHPSLRFKPIHPSLPIYSVRVGAGHRAAGVMEGDLIVWFWIGSHADYDRLISQWRRKS
ncbi:MAG: hypothetical protein EPO64_09800 [Nitrospirae bacterium]|nr:MAG: hypothetical protein EPO64_09800 [Nitrospirota bacterium]